MQCGHRGRPLRAGSRIVEEGRTEEVFANPQHPYTAELLAAADGSLQSPVVTLAVFPKRDDAGACRSIRVAFGGREMVGKRAD